MSPSFEALRWFPLPPACLPPEQAGPEIERMTAARAGSRGTPVNPGLTDIGAAVSAAAADQNPPAWSRVLAVVAHPDDETFGLGAVIDLMRQAGASVDVLCFTHGEASALNETGATLHAARSRELRQANAELGVTAVDLLDYADGQLSCVPAAELAARIISALDQYRPDGMLVFDETGVTGHPDHQAATAAALHAVRSRGLPVLAWALPDAIADQLRRETGQLDLHLRVNRATQRQAALADASQISPSAVLWRRLQLLGDHEHLRWLRSPDPAY
jgi:LmbE family N-acetylglucosaminyl deacetylase